MCGPPAQLTDVSIPESGTTKFTYNSDGLTYQRIRAKANQANACPFSPYDSAKCITTTYTYDNIHRLTQVAYDDGVTPTASYAYDQTSVNSVSPQNPVGRLTSYSAGTASGMYSYDAMGRTVSDWQVPPSKSGTGNFLQSRTYDKAGNVKTFSDAVNTTFYLTYDSGGNLTQVTTPFADSTHPGTLFTANTSDYGRFGLGAYVAGGSINSGVKTVLSYTNFGELTSKSATDTGGTGTTRFSMGTMSYAPNGMLTGATVNSSAWSHAYDDMGRILTSQNSSTVTYGYQYDRYGNRWHQNVTAGTGNQVDMPTDNTTNKISTTGITQDALGNITNDGSHTYTFDAENRITQVDSGSTATYVYDAFNRRVKKTVGATAREFLFDAADRPFVEVGNNGTSWIRTEIFLGGVHLATYSNGHTYFHHQNWLGSRATTTDETGAKVQDCEWYPFGDLKACTTNSNLYAYTPYGYADYERDSETGLDHMQFRYYNSRIGRFLSADPLGGSLGSAQSLNKFAYVRNTPVNGSDPLGLQDNVCGAEFSFSDCGGGSGFWGGGSFGNSVGQYNRYYGGLPPNIANPLKSYDERAAATISAAIAIRNGWFWVPTSRNSRYPYGCVVDIAKNSPTADIVVCPVGGMAQDTLLRALPTQYQTRTRLSFRRARGTARDHQQLNGCLVGAVVAGTKAIIPLPDHIIDDPVGAAKDALNATADFFTNPVSVPTMIYGTAGMRGATAEALVDAARVGGAALKKAVPWISAAMFLNDAYEYLNEQDTAGNCGEFN